MKHSEVMKELISAYHFTHGKRVNEKLVEKAIKIQKQFEKEGK